MRITIRMICVVSIIVRHFKVWLHNKVSFTYEQDVNHVFFVDTVGFRPCVEQGH